MFEPPESEAISSVNKTVAPPVPVVFFDQVVFEDSWTHEPVVPEVSEPEVTVTRAQYDDPMPVVVGVAQFAG